MKNEWRNEQQAQAHEKFLNEKIRLKKAAQEKMQKAAKAIYLGGEN